MTGSKRAFRFGVTQSRAESRQDWIDSVRRIEALGYSVLTIADHFPERLGIVAALMAAADATEHLRVASWVFCNDFRHPAVLYKEAATIDLLSGGRLELGIGAGWLKSEYDMVGIPFDAPGVRVSRMFEAVRILKGLASGEPFSFEGEHYRIDGFDGAPKPAQTPLPPLSIGGGGKRVLSFGAREADIVSITAKALPEGGLAGDDITFEATQRKAGWVCDAAGERDPELNVLIYTFELTGDRDAAAQRHAEALGLTVDQVLASPHVLIGTVDQMIEALEHRRRELGISYIVLNTNVREHTEQFAPVVTALSGR
jgi:probable F420-dependent oxidoreductase